MVSRMCKRAVRRRRWPRHRGRARRVRWSPNLPDVAAATPQQRAAVLLGAARLLRERQEEIARTATLEEGKTLAESRIEVMMNVTLF